ncbi:MAG TPA: hypothetical protein VH539_24270 [Gemmatimonadaceae bacterium]|jgi:hypothetical protein
MIAAALSRAPLAFVEGRPTIAANEVIDFVSVFFDESLDLLSARAGLWTCVGYGAAEAHVIANEIFSRRIGERVFHIRLLDLVVAVDVSAIVCFAALRHVLMLHAAVHQPCRASSRPAGRRAFQPEASSVAR